MTLRDFDGGFAGACIVGSDTGARAALVADGAAEFVEPISPHPPAILATKMATVTIKLRDVVPKGESSLPVPSDRAVNLPHADL